MVVQSQNLRKNTRGYWRPSLVLPPHPSPLDAMVSSCISREGCDSRSHLYLRDVLTRLPDMTNHKVPQLVPGKGPKHRRSPTNTIVLIVIVILSRGAPGDAYPGSDPTCGRCRGCTCVPQR